MNGFEAVLSKWGSNPQIVVGAATLLGALGMWLMLPGGARHSRIAGAVLAAAGLVLFALLLAHPMAAQGAADQTPAAEADGNLANRVGTVLFFILAGVTVVSAAAAVTFRNPVYCAIWFGLSLLGTAGLFLFQGAQFLGVATVVVYAGAILVTFLFVLMLAQPGGYASYDRISWEPLLSAFTGALFAGVLTLTIVTVFQKPDATRGLKPPADSQHRIEGVLADQHTARLGAELFSRHLVAVEAAGTLLLVALVGAIAITAHGAQVRGLASRAHHGANRHG